MGRQIIVGSNWITDYDLMFWFVDKDHNHKKWMSHIETLKNKNKNHILLIKNELFPFEK